MHHWICNILIMNCKLNILITLLAAVCISGCMPTHYYDPEVIETSDSEAKISFLGEICWFQVNWNYVQTKFQPGRAFKPFKYVIKIEGTESADPVIIQKDSELAELTARLESEFPEFYENWLRENGRKGYGIIAFEVPANPAQTERRIEVKVSIAKDYRDTENWGVWETVFSSVQEGSAQ